MATETLRVEGLTELIGSLNNASKALGREVKDELRVVAEPVRAQAEVLATQRISRVGPMRPRSWARMKTGVSRKGAYVVPKQRNRTGQHRKNMGKLLVREMEAALEQNRDAIVRRTDKLVDNVLSSHNL